MTSATKPRGSAPTGPSRVPVKAPGSRRRAAHTAASTLATSCRRATGGQLGQGQRASQSRSVPSSTSPAAASSQARVQAASEQVTGAFMQERDDALETYDQLQRSIEQYHDRMFGVAVEEEGADEADEENAEAGNRQAADTMTTQAKKKNVRMSTAGRRSYAAPAVNA